MTAPFRIEHPTIYINANGETTNALLIVGNEIVAIGEEALQTEVPNTLRPGGPCIMPALADSHIHMWGLGLNPRSLSLKSASSSEDVYCLLEGEHSVPWVFAHDWDQNQWAPNDSLSLERVDRLFPNQPLVLRRIDGHAIFVNSTAARLSKINLVNGLLREKEMMRVLDVAPKPSINEDERIFRDLSLRLFQYGITSAHIAWVDYEHLNMLERLRKERALPIRIHAMLAGHDPKLKPIIENSPRIDSERFLNIATIKYFADGALGSQGADVLSGYATPSHSSGESLDEDHFIRSWVETHGARGWQPAIHAIGDRAVHRVLGFYRELPETTRKKIRPRIEHLQMIETDDLQYLEHLIASIQPIHRYSDCEWAHRILNDEQVQNLFRWREMQQRIPVCAGSDFPIEDPNPWHGMSVAISRKVRNRPDDNSKGFTNKEAVRIYTEGAAYASFWENSLGRLNKGFLADFIIPSQDPFSATPDEIWEIKVDALWFNGKREF